MSSAAATKVCKVTWKSEDHLQMLNQILNGVSADNVEECWVAFMEMHIEPVGWQAVWRSSLTMEMFNLSTSVDLIVEVLDVSREKLVADVHIIDVCEIELVSKSDQEKINTAKKVEHVVPVVQLYPLAEQENKVLNIGRTADLIEQLRFFYSYIWQPWDTEDNCFYNHFLVNERFKLHQDMKSGAIPAVIAVEMHRVASEATAIKGQMELLASADSNEEIDGSQMVQLMLLHRRMESLHETYIMLQDPLMRDIAIHQRQVETQGMMKVGLQESQVKIVIDCLAIDQLNALDGLNALLNSAPELITGATVQGFPSLQVALDTASIGDIIVLLSGTHEMLSFDSLASGGSIIGLGHDVVIKGNPAAGDLLFNVYGDLRLANLTVQPHRQQTAITLHKGCITLQNVIVQGGECGVSIMSGGNCIITDTTIEKCRKYGLELREKSVASVVNCQLNNNGDGISMDESSKVSLVSTTIQSNKNAGICVIWPGDFDLQKLLVVPQEGLFVNLLEKFESCVVKENDIGITICHPHPKTPFGSQPSASTPSSILSFSGSENEGMTPIPMASLSISDSSEYSRGEDSYDSPSASPPNHSDAVSPEEERTNENGCQ